jgi:dolichyl-phosphate beta-glucosyltransferase
MANFADMFVEVINGAVELSKDAPPYILFSLVFTTFIASSAFVSIPILVSKFRTNHKQLYGLIFLLAPTPRAPHPSEKTYITSTPSGDATPPKPLPCWHDDWLAHRDEAATTKAKHNVKHTGAIEGPEVMMSVVVPAYNEEERMEIMLEEAVTFLDEEYGRTPNKDKRANGSAEKDTTKGMGGYEILIVNDGSRDKTVDVALSFAKRNNLHDILRVCTLKENRGKGGAVTHGFRHVRGAYAVFADADGASKFSDLRKLVKGCQEVEDSPGRGIAVGSRAHMVGTEAVVKVRPPLIPS